SNSLSPRAGAGMQQVLTPPLEPGQVGENDRTAQPDLLVIEDDAIFSAALGAAIEQQGLSYVLAEDGESGLRLAKQHKARGLALLETLQNRGSDMPSVVVYTGRALTKTELTRFKAYTESVVMKEGPAVERVVDELRLFAERLKRGDRRKTNPPHPPTSPFLR